MRRPFVLCLSMCSLACVRGPPAEAPPARYTAEQLPEAWKPAVQRSTEAMSALQAALIPRLMEALGKEGPASAVRVCREEAQPIAAQAAAEKGLELGRTSFRLRNPANAPRAWARPWVLQAEGKKAAEVSLTVVDLKASLGVLRPIPTAAFCTQCHGPKEQLAPDTLAALEVAYPQDQATGFVEGDLRGFFWAEVPKDR